MKATEPLIGLLGGGGVEDPDLLASFHPPKIRVSSRVGELLAEYMVVLVLLMRVEYIDDPADVVEIMVVLIIALQKLEDLTCIVVEYIRWHCAWVMWRKNDFDEFLDQTSP